MIQGEAQSQPPRLTPYRSVPHLRTGGVRTLRDQLESSSRTAVGAFRANRAFVQQFKLVGFEPHELETFGAATDLR